jgi:hypothetical protein
VTHDIRDYFGAFLKVSRRLFSDKYAVIWAVVSTLLFFPSVDSVPAPDPDSSWKAGLVMAHSGGLRFGRDLVFTYGPLGFVGHPLLWGTRSLVAIALAVIVLCGLILAGSRILARLLTAPVAAMVSAIGVRLAWRYEASIVTPLVFTFLCITLRYLLSFQNASTRRCALSGAAAALLVLTKADTVTYGAMALGCLVLSGPSRPTFRVMLRRVLVIVFSFLGLLTLGWVALGQPLGSMNDWVTNSLRVAFGFNENMVYRAPPFAPRLAVIASVIVISALLFMLLSGQYQEAKNPFGKLSNRWWAITIVLLFVIVTLWMAAKSGFVRFDGHAYRYLWYLAFVTVVMVSKVPEVAKVRPSKSPVEAAGGINIFRVLPTVMFAATAGLAAVIAFAGIPAGARSLLRPNGAANLARAMEPLVSGSRRAEITAVGTKRILHWVNLSDGEVAALSGKRVHAESEDIAVLWALSNTLTWKPNPIMQSTNAYTPELDERNANGYRDALRGPEVVLYHAVPGDGHHPRFQSPAAVVALICNFVPTVAPNSFSQVLARSENRCGAEGSREKVRGRLGQRLTWTPKPGDETMVIVGRVHLERRFTERVSAVLRVRPRSWTYQLGAFDNGGVYRFDPGTASQPHLLSIPECLRVGLPRVDTRTYDSLLIDEDDEAPRIPVSLEVSRIPYRCP